jgi:hypothetical protein
MESELLIRYHDERIELHLLPDLLVQLPVE